MSKVYIVCEDKDIAWELKDAMCSSNHAVYHHCPPEWHGKACPHDLPEWEDKHNCARCWKKWFEENVEVVSE